MSPEDGSLEALREKLLRGGIAPRHVRRYLGELADHLEDLKAQERRDGYRGRDADARARVRLGSDAELADAMLAQRQFRSLSARAPWLVFGIAPLFVMILASILPALGLVWLMASHGLLGKHPLPAPDWLAGVATGIGQASNLLVYPLVTSLFVALAWRQRIRLIWPILGVGVVLLLFLHMDTGMSHILPNPAGLDFALRYKPAFVRVGLTPLFSRATWSVMAAQWPWVTAQYLLTLLPLAWLYRAQRRVDTCEA